MKNSIILPNSQTLKISAKVTRKALTKVFWCHVSIINYNLLNSFVTSDSELSKEPSAKENKASQEYGSEISKAEKEKCKKDAKETVKAKSQMMISMWMSWTKKMFVQKLKKKYQEKQLNLTKCLWPLKKLDRNEKFDI